MRFAAVDTKFTERTMALFYKNKNGVSKKEEKKTLREHSRKP